MSRSNPGQPRADLSAWAVESMRLTTFHPSPLAARVAGVWAEVVSQEPENIQDNRKSGEYTESGSWQELSLVLNVQTKPARIDWVSTAPESFEGPSPAIPLPEKFDAFVAMMGRWLAHDQRPPVIRLALGLSVRLGVSSHAEGYRRLSDYLPFDIDRSASSDFLYQINRRRDSTALPGTQINRLTQWSSLHTMRAHFMISADQTTASPIQEGESYCRINLDLNTAPYAEVGQTIPAERLPALQEELAGFAREIVLEGDIA